MSASVSMDWWQPRSSHHSQMSLDRYLVRSLVLPTDTFGQEMHRSAEWQHDEYVHHDLH